MQQSERLGKVLNFRHLRQTRDESTKEKLNYEPEERPEEAFRRGELLFSLGNQLQSFLLVISHCSAGFYDNFTDSPP